MIIPFDYETYDLLHQDILCGDYVWHNKDAVIPLNQDITGLSFSVGKNLNKTYYIPRNHRDSDNWSDESFLKVVRALLKGHSVAHNHPFELVTSVCSLGIDIDEFEPSRSMDTHELASQVDENQSKGLKSLTKAHLGVQQQTYAEVLEAAGATDMRGLSTEQVLHYGADDSFLCGRLTYLFLTNMLLEGTYEHRHLTMALQKELARSYIKGTDYDFDRASVQEAKDRATIANNMPVIRGILKDEADWGANVEATTRWSEADVENRVAMLAADGLETGQIKAKIGVEFKNFLSKTHYEEWEEVEQPIKVVKSVAFLRSVMPALHLPVPKTVSNKGITETYSELELSEKQFEFVGALLNAKKGTPSWGEYEKLCLKYTDKVPRVVQTGFECNLGSSLQKQVILYGMLGCQVRRRSKVQAGSKRMKLGCGGAPATDAGAIQMAITHDADTFEKYACLELLLDVVKARTRLSLFHDAYKNWKHLDGRVRPAFATSSTRTRRPTGSAPNFLQLPKGDRIRGSVVAPKGHIVISVDWSAQELRECATLTKDPNLLSAYQGDKPKDVHSLMGATIARYFFVSRNHTDLVALWDEELKEAEDDYTLFMSWRKKGKDDKRGKISNEIRGRVSKNLVFSQAFHGSTYSIIDLLMVEEEDAIALVELRDSLFPGYATWKSRVTRFIERWGFVNDLYGQRYHFPKRGGYAAREVRQACNAQSQGGGAYMLYTSARRFHDLKLHEKYNAQLMYGIYDELVVTLEYRGDEQLFSFLNEFCDCMRVDYGAGFWAEESHLVPQVPEATLYPRGRDGRSRWAVGGIELPQVFSLADVVEAKV